MMQHFHQTHSVFFFFFSSPKIQSLLLHCSMISTWMFSFLSLRSPFNSRCGLILCSFFLLRLIFHFHAEVNFCYAIQSKLSKTQNFSFNTSRMIKPQLIQSPLQSPPRQQAYTGTQGYNTNRLFACFVIPFYIQIVYLFIFFTVPFISLTDLNRKQHANRKVRNCIKSAKMYSFKRRYIHPHTHKKKSCPLKL